MQGTQVLKQSWEKQSWWIDCGFGLQMVCQHKMVRWAYRELKVRRKLPFMVVIDQAFKRTVFSMNELAQIGICNLMSKFGTTSQAKDLMC